MNFIRAPGLETARPDSEAARFGVRRESPRPSQRTLRRGNTFVDADVSYSYVFLSIALGDRQVKKRCRIRASFDTEYLVVTWLCLGLARWHATRNTVLLSFGSCIWPWVVPFRLPASKPERLVFHWTRSEVLVLYMSRNTYG